MVRPGLSVIAFRPFASLFSSSKYPLAGPTACPAAQLCGVLEGSGAATRMSDRSANVPQQFYSPLLALALLALRPLRAEEAPLACEPRPREDAASAASRARVDRLRMRALLALASVPVVLTGVPS